MDARNPPGPARPAPPRFLPPYRPSSIPPFRWPRRCRWGPRATPRGRTSHRSRCRCPGSPSAAPCCGRAATPSLSTRPRPLCRCSRARCASTGRRPTAAQTTSLSAVTCTGGGSSCFHRSRRSPFPPIPPLPGPGPDATEAGTVAAAASSPDAGAQALDQTDIPIFARSRYHSYLKITQVTAPAIVIRPRPCTVTLVAEQFDYTHPPAGQFKGSFPAAASRTVTLSLTAGPSLSGRWSHLRRTLDRGRRRQGRGDAALGVAVLPARHGRDRHADGAVAPQPVPDGAGGTEFFDTIYAKHGWRAHVVSDQTGVPVPPGVTPNDCWIVGQPARPDDRASQPGDQPGHRVADPPHRRSGQARLQPRGDVRPDRRAAGGRAPASPTTATRPATRRTSAPRQNQKQRDVPRAFLRSATHEITHTFNQIHQEQETAADNSIMTTTPSVADVLGGPTTGAPGVFPDQINLAREHHGAPPPQPHARPGDPARRLAVRVAGSAARSRRPPTATTSTRPSSTSTVTVGPAERVVLGAAGRAVLDADQPQRPGRWWCPTTWPRGAVRRDHDHRLGGWRRDVPAVRRSPATRPKLAELAPGESVSAEHRVFWSHGRLRLPAAGPLPRRRRGDLVRGRDVRSGGECAEVYVDFPTHGTDNEAAGLMMHSEVGKWVALGGEAYHLTEATRRLLELADAERSRGRRGCVPTGCWPSLEGLLPDPERVAGGRVPMATAVADGAATCGDPPARPPPRDAVGRGCHDELRSGATAGDGRGPDGRADRHLHRRPARCGSTAPPVPRPATSRSSSSSALRPGARSSTCASPSPVAGSTGSR